MIKIDSINVSGYKNITNAKLDFSNFNVIIGPNNSGKSNLIQVIPFLNYIINGSYEEVKKSFNTRFIKSELGQIVPYNYLSFDEKKKKKNQPISFSLHFSNTKSNNIFNYNIDLSYNITDFSIEIYSESLYAKNKNKTGKAIEIFNRKRTKVGYNASIQNKGLFEVVEDSCSVLRFLQIFSGLDSIFKDALDSLNIIVNTPIFYFSHTELSKPSNERVENYNNRMIAYNVESDIIALNDRKNKISWELYKKSLNEILNISQVFVYEEKLNEISKTINRYVFFDHYDRFKPLSQFSDGTILIIALITKIICEQRSIFILEEPENSIHPKALMDLIQFIRSYSDEMQFILTSHSIAILNQSSIEEIKVSEVDKNGHVVFSNVIDDKELTKKLKKSVIDFSEELFFNQLDKEEPFK